MRIFFNTVLRQNIRTVFVTNIDKVVQKFIILYGCMFNNEYIKNAV